MAVDRSNEEEITAYARYLVARGDFGDAAQVLSKVLPIVRDGGWVEHEIHALVLQVLAHELSGERALALESLGRATRLGEPGRFNRTFTGEGPVITGLVEALADAVRRGHGPAEAGSSSYLTYLLPEKGVKPKTASAQSAAAGLAEPLTMREVEILRLVAAGMRNQEIADHLFISLSTVKRPHRECLRQARRQSPHRSCRPGKRAGSAVKIRRELVGASDGLVPQEVGTT